MLFIKFHIFSFFCVIGFSLTTATIVAIDGEDVTDLSIPEIMSMMKDKSEYGCLVTVITSVRQECRSVGTV